MTLYFIAKTKVATIVAYYTPTTKSHAVAHQLILSNATTEPGYTDGEHTQYDVGKLIYFVP